MALLDNTIPRDGDPHPVTSKKILQRLNAAAGIGVAAPVPTTVIGTKPHDGNIVEGDPALVTRPASTFAFDVARGLHPEHSNIHKFGFNAAIPNGSFADVYTYGGTVAVYPWPTSAQKVRIRAGGDAADTSDGDGARSILVQGLDANFAPIEETIVTKGALVSAETTQLFFRVFRAYVTSVGVYGAANTDDILIENASDADVIAHIPAGIGQTQQTHYTVPAGKSAYLVSVQVQVAAGTTKDADVRLFQRLDGSDVAVPYGAKRLVMQFIGQQGAASFPFATFVSFPEKTDLWCDAQGNGAVTGVNVTYDLFLI
jgi:hypothetical protein